MRWADISCRDSGVLDTERLSWNRRMGARIARSIHVAGVCPLYPHKRTFSEPASMSAKCQKRTLSAPANLILMEHLILLPVVSFKASMRTVNNIPCAYSLSIWCAAH